MDIAAMSIDLSSSRIMSGVGTAVLKKAIEQQENTFQELLDIIPADPFSGVGQNIDVMA